MSKKVFHVPEDVHKEVGAFCRANGMVIKEFVCETLLSAVKRGIPKKIDAQPVSIKPNIVPAVVESDKEIYNRPPFWETK